MEVFAFREELVAEYERFPRRFTNIRASDVSCEVDAALVGGSFWPAPHVQLNPRFNAREWGDGLVGNGTHGTECAKILPFKHANDTSGERLLLYRHQTDAFAIATHKALLHYALKALGLDTDPAARRAQDQQIVLPNATKLTASTPAPDSVSRVEA